MLLGRLRLVLRKTVDGKEKVSLVLDFQSMYSTNNLGYGKLYKEIVDRVNMYLQIGSATAIRAMDHACARRSGHQTFAVLTASS